MPETGESGIWDKYHNGRRSVEGVVTLAIVGFLGVGLLGSIASIVFLAAFRVEIPPVLAAMAGSCAGGLSGLLGISTHGRSR